MFDVVVVVATDAVEAGTFVVAEVLELIFCNCPEKELVVEVLSVVVGLGLELERATVLVAADEMRSTEMPPYLNWMLHCWLLKVFGRIENDEKSAPSLRLTILHAASDNYVSHLKLTKITKLTPFESLELAELETLPH